jgi:hypothetical protein
MFVSGEDNEVPGGGKVVEKSFFADMRLDGTLPYLNFDLKTLRKYMARPR